MVSSNLIEFQRNDHAADGSEKTANFLLKPLRLASGRVVAITQTNDSPFIDQAKINIIGRLFLFAFSFTLWLPCTLIGLAIHLFSGSHKEAYQAYSAIASGYMPIQDSPPTEESSPRTTPSPSQEPPTRTAPSPAPLFRPFRPFRLLLENPKQAVLRILRQQGMPLTDAIDEAESLICSEHLSLHLKPQSPLRDIQAQKTHVNNFRTEVIKTYNDKIILGLSDYLKTPVSIEAVDAFFANESNFPPEVVSNQRICTFEDCFAIQIKLEATQSATAPSFKGPVELKREFDEIMTSLQTQLIRGEVRANPRSIFSNFPRLKTLIPQLQAHGVAIGFPQIIGMGFIFQEMARPTLHLSTNAEKYLLQALGLNVDQLEERKIDRKNRLQMRISRENFLISHRGEMLPHERQLLNGTQLFLKRTALTERLKDAEGNETLAPYLMPLIDKLEQREKQLQRLLIKCSSGLEIRMKADPFFTKKADLRARILKRYQIQLRARIKQDMDVFTKKLIEDSGMKYYLPTLDDFHAKIAPLLPLLKTDMTLRIIRIWTKTGESLQQICFGWHSQWGNPIEKDLVQGVRDSSECLGGGVCDAISTRLMLLEQRNPLISQDHLHSQVTLLPEDRFHHAEYILSDHSTLARRTEGPQNTRNERLLRHGIRELQPHFIAYSLAEFLEKMFSRSLPGQLKETNGVLGIYLSYNDFDDGHMCYLRIDPEHQVIRFFDPNIGMSKNFYPQEGGDFEAAIQEMSTCFADHLAQSSSDLRDIMGVQYHLQPIARPASSRRAESPHTQLDRPTMRTVNQSLFPWLTGTL